MFNKKLPSGDAAKRLPGRLSDLNRDPADDMGLFQHPVDHHLLGVPLA